MGALDKTVDKLVGLHLMVDQGSGANTTVNAALAAGGTAITFAGASSFAIGDNIRLGSGETQEFCTLASGSGTSWVLAKGAQFAHAVGEAIVEQNAVNLGKVEATGLAKTITGESVDVFTADVRLKYAEIPGFFDIRGTFSFPTVTVDAIAYAWGLVRSGLVGDATNVAQTGTAGPRLLTTNGSGFGGQTGLNIVACFQRTDGTYARYDFFNVSIDPTAFSISFARGQLTTVPVAFWASGLVMNDTNSVFVPQTTLSTYAPTKSDIFAEIEDVDTVTDSGTSTTTTGSVAAGAYVIPVTSATGIVAGGFISIGVGDAKEIHQVHGLSSLNVNLYTQVQAAHASGVAVTVQTVTALAGVVGGFRMNVSGSATPLRSETQRVTCGIRISNAAVELATELNAITTTNLMLALNMPTSALSSSVLNMHSALGTQTTPPNLLFRGKTQGGTKVHIVGWACSAKINSTTNYTQASEARIPVSLSPTTVQVYNRAA